MVIVSGVRERLWMVLVKKLEVNSSGVECGYSIAEEMKKYKSGVG
jgi:hypothetical protein